MFASSARISTAMASGLSLCEIEGQIVQVMPVAPAAEQRWRLVIDVVAARPYDDPTFTRNDSDCSEFVAQRVETELQVPRDETPASGNGIVFRRRMVDVVLQNGQYATDMVDRFLHLQRLERNASKTQEARP